MDKMVGSYSSYRATHGVPWFLFFSTRTYFKAKWYGSYVAHVINIVAQFYREGGSTYTVLLALKD